MRWDWESFPEYLDSLERGKLGECGVTHSLFVRCARTRWAMMRLVIRRTKPLGLTFEQFLLVAAAPTPNDLHT
jgi:hypothetical protein